MMIDATSTVPWQIRSRSPYRVATARLCLSFLKQRSTVLRCLCQPESKAGGLREEEEEEGELDGGSTDAGLCLQSTGGDVNFATCGSDGAVWIQILSADGLGIYHENRYLYDQGEDQYLTVAGTFDGDRLYCHAKVIWCLAGLGVGFYR